MTTISPRIASVAAGLLLLTSAAALAQARTLKSLDAELYRKLSTEMER